MIGNDIDALWKLKEEKKAIEAKLKIADENIKLAEGKIISELEKLGLDKASGKKATVSLRVSVVPQVEDWEKFHAYIVKQKAPYLLERRASVTACRELFEKGKTIPGVGKFDKVALGLTTLKPKA